MCITDLYITLTLVPTGVNSTIVYLRLYLINTPLSSVTPEILQSKRYRRYLEIKNMVLNNAENPGQLRTCINKIACSVCT